MCCSLWASHIAMAACTSILDLPTLAVIGGGGDAGHSPECGWGTGVLRLCPGTLAEGSLYDRLKEICQVWCWLALCQSDVAQLIKVPQRTGYGEPMAIFLV